MNTRQEGIESPRGSRMGAKFDEWDVNLPAYVDLEASTDPLAGDIKNTYTSPSAEDIHVRGPGYLNGEKVVDRTCKIPSEESPYLIAGINVYRCKSDLTHIASKVASLRDHVALQGAKDLKGSLYPQFLIITWNFRNSWTKEQTCVVHLFRRNDSLLLNGDDCGMADTFRRAFSSFIKGDQDSRSRRLKFIFKVREATPSVKKINLGAWWGETGPYCQEINHQVF
mmetsp:Transcript_1357/g.2219  ORF Transcript_1357/g.2219 Transcript_1357/m.2219 type:complete len:225 (+) Transcript_1357:65-739(+)